MDVQIEHVLSDSAKQQPHPFGALVHNQEVLNTGLSDSAVEVQHIGLDFGVPLRHFVGER